MDLMKLTIESGMGCVDGDFLLTREEERHMFARRTEFEWVDMF